MPYIEAKAAIQEGLRHAQAQTREVATFMVAAAGGRADRVEGRRVPPSGEARESQTGRDGGRADRERPPEEGRGGRVDLTA